MKAACAGPAPADHVDVPHPAVPERLERVPGDIGVVELLGVRARMRTTSTATLPIPMTATLSWREVELPVAVVGVPVVPADEIGRGVAPRQVLARDAERPVALGAAGVDHRVVVAEQIRAAQVRADPHVAEEPHPRVGGDLLVDPGDRLDLLVIGRDAAAHQPEGCRQPVEEVDLDLGRVLEQMLRGVEPGGSGADDGDAQRGAMDMAAGTYSGSRASNQRAG